MVNANARADIISALGGAFPLAAIQHPLHVHLLHFFSTMSASLVPMAV